MDETELLDRARAGDRDAFYQLVSRHERSIFWAAFGMLGNSADAEEVAQETFLRCFEKLHQFRGEAKFSTWATQIAVNEARLRLRKQRPALHDSLDAPERGDDEDMAPRELADWRKTPEEEYAGEELRRLVQSALQGLPPAYRIVLVMRDLEQRSTEEVAQALGLSLAAAKTRLLRARLRMREALSAHFARPAAGQARDGWWRRLGRFGRRRLTP